MNKTKMEPFVPPPEINSFSAFGGKAEKEMRKKSLLTSHLYCFSTESVALSRDGAEIFYQGLLIHYSHLPELAIITALYIESRGE